MSCLICKENDFMRIHKGTRDNSQINVLRCNKCGMVWLDSQRGNTGENYEKDMMRRKIYNGSENVNESMDWSAWVNNTTADDERRYQALKELCTGKKVLDFGCGCGGFLKRIRNEAEDITGVELSEEAYKRLSKEQIRILKNIDETDEKYDIILSFQVIEHINNPDEWLESIKRHLNINGIFVCETPNANDALLSKYNSEEFADFTYWSNHVFLYSSDTLNEIMERHGFKALNNTQIMRYNLANHLYWLSKGAPRGDKKWLEFNTDELMKAYADVLITEKRADTLWYIAEKVSE